MSLEGLAIIGFILMAIMAIVVIAGIICYFFIPSRWALLSFAVFFIFCHYLNLAPLLEGNYIEFALNDFLGATLFIISLTAILPLLRWRILRKKSTDIVLQTKWTLITVGLSWLLLISFSVIYDSMVMTSV